MTRDPKGRVLSLMLTFFGMSLAQSGADFEEALQKHREQERTRKPCRSCQVNRLTQTKRYRKPCRSCQDNLLTQRERVRATYHPRRVNHQKRREYDQKFQCIHRVNHQKHQKFLQFEQDHEEWKAREALRKRCLVPLCWPEKVEFPEWRLTDYEMLNQSNRTRVNILIVFLFSREVFVRWNNPRPSFSAVLTDSSKPERFRFPWDLAVLVVQFFILAVMRDQREARTRWCREQNSRRIRYLIEEEEFFRRTRHVCRCPYDDLFGELVRDCDCYQVYLDEQRAERNGGEHPDRREIEDWEHQVDFPDGVAGEHSRNKIDRDRSKAQKRNSRYRLPRKPRVRGGRPGWCQQGD